MGLSKEAAKLFGDSALKKELPSDWYEKLSSDKLQLEISYAEWVELAGALQQLVIDRGQTDEYTEKRNQSDPIDSQWLTDLAAKIEDRLYAHRDKIYSTPPAD